MTQRDLVVCSLEAWDQVWRRNQHLVSELLRADDELRVLFVEPPADPVHALRQRRLPRPGRGLRRVGAGPGDGDLPGAARLWALEPTKWLPRVAGPGADHALVAQVRRAAGRLSFGRPLLWVNDPALAPLVAATGWPALYDITDDWLRFRQSDRARQRLRANEELLLARCRAVVVCSPDLARTKGADRPVDLIPNAVDVEPFRRELPRPDDLPDGPCAVYVGTLHGDRVDVDLCVSTARSLREGQHLVFVGPDLLPPSDQERLRAEPRIAVLGPRPFDQVPAYLQHATVLVVPHLVSAFTESLDPIKRYEYRAAGRPVVSTPVAGFRELEGTEVASGPEFAEAVARALGTGSVPPLPATPAVPSDVPTWRQRATEMRAVLDRVSTPG